MNFLKSGALFSLKHTIGERKLKPRKLKQLKLMKKGSKLYYRRKKQSLNLER